VEKAVCHIIGNNLLTDYNLIADNFPLFIHDRLIVKASISAILESSENFHIVCIINRLSELTIYERGQILQRAWERLENGGLLVIYENPEELTKTIDLAVLDKLLRTYGQIIYYSSLVASRLSEDNVITHYSSMLEEELIVENQDRKAVFRVVQKH
jgi:hypothetical protein